MACRHVDEMLKEGITENLAIRILELFVDVYSKLLNGGSATPHNAGQVEYWSLAAHKVKNHRPYGKFVRVEHGAPRRGLARKVLDIYHKHKLDESEMNKLVKKHWKLAVITLEEDRRLNKIARSKMYKAPELRWKAAGIRFE